MPAPAFVDRQNDRLSGTVKSSNQVIDERGADKRMINQKKNDAVGLRRQAAKCCLNRTQLPFFPLFIDYDLVGRQIHFLRDRLRIRAEHDPANTDLWMTSYIQ